MAAPPAMAAACKRAGDAFATAAAAAETPPRRRQVLLLVKGLPGAGKSALALALARRLRWPIVDKDDARDALELTFARGAAAAAAAPPAALAATADGDGGSTSGRAPPLEQQQQEQDHHHQQQQQQLPDQQGHPPPAALTDLNAASYEIMFRFAAAQLRAGLCCVVDCPFSRRGLYERACAIAAEHGAVVALVECAPSDKAAWRARLEARAAADAAAAPEKRHKPGSWEELSRLVDGYAGCWRWSYDASPPLPCRFEVDTAAFTPAEAAAGVVRWLAAGGLLDEDAAAAAAAAEA